MLEDYFARKRAQLGMDRQDALSFVQGVLDEWYPGQARAKKLHLGVLRVITPNASVAADLRLRQRELLSRLQTHGTAAGEVQRLQIGIRSLD